MKIFSLIAIVAIAISPAAQAQDNGEAFYDAFKALCADTAAQPNSVKMAVEAAPFTAPHYPSSTSTTIPFPMTVTGWDINWNGHKFTVNSGTSRAPYGMGQVRDSISCAISSHSDEDTSVATIRKWVGIQPDPNSHSQPGITLYSFREDGSTRMAIIGDAAAKSASTEGRTWLLTIIQQSNVASVQLVHWLAPTARKSN